MKSDDPNFPQEIPPIPEPRKDDSAPETSADGPENGAPAHQEPWTDATDSGNPEEIEPAPVQPVEVEPDHAINNDESFSSQDIDYDETLEADYGEPRPPAAKPAAALREEALRPSARQARATDARPREAEKPAAASEPFDDWGQTEVPYQPKELGIIDQILLLLADGAAGWKKVLRWVRSQLPPTWQRRLSDEIMTAIALGLLVLFLALWNPLGSGKPAGPVAQQPGSEPVSEAPQLPGEPTLVDEEAPEVAPAPGISALPETTPEQGMIADIQDKVSAISRSYAAGLIQSVEVNLPENRLMVNLSESWYGLLQPQQEEVSQNIYEQVQQLNFKTLQLRDPSGLVVARNPVVGHQMVILHRSRPSEADLLFS